MNESNTAVVEHDQTQVAQIMAKAAGGGELGGAVYRYLVDSEHELGEDNNGNLIDIDDSNHGTWLLQE